METKTFAPSTRPRNSLGVGHYDAKIVDRKPQSTAVKNSEVYETVNYAAFHMDEKNRPINEEKVTVFMRQFKKGKNFMREFPAIVDHNHLILDGQHRYVALKRLELAFYYRYASSLTIDNVVDVQSNAGWHTSDFLHAFIKQKKQDYIVLNRFIQRYDISISIAVALLTQSMKSSLKKRGFYQGLFKIVDETWAHDKAKMIFELGELAWNLHKDAKFCGALVKVFQTEDYDHKRMVTQMKKYNSLLRRQVTTDAYIENFEEVYNYKLYTKNKVRFI